MFLTKVSSLAGAVRSMMLVTIELLTPKSVLLSIMFTMKLTQGLDAADVVWNNTFCFLCFFVSLLFSYCIF